MIRSRSTRTFQATGLVLGAGMLALSLVACAGSAPVRAVRAARYYAAGTRALDRGESRAAIEALEFAVDLMPNASEIHNHLGLAYWSEGRSEEALRELEHAVELDCENEAARVNLARLRAESHVDGRVESGVEGGAGTGAANRETGFDGGERSVRPLRVDAEGSAVHGG